MDKCYGWSDQGNKAEWYMGASKIHMERGQLV